LEVVLDVLGYFADVLLLLDGTGTARNPATSEMHRLSIHGLHNSINIDTARDIGPGGVLLGGGQATGHFHGYMSRDGRTWPGRFTAATHSFAAPIFGSGQHAVTLTKD
jgi:hypothetical protein